jgi:predicted 2-oxoglutarate/Fe(II)-dependent dioxygenase YbiX
MTDDYTRQFYGSLSNVHVIADFISAEDLQTIAFAATTSEYTRGGFASHAGTEGVSELARVIESIERRASFEFGVRLSRYDGDGLFNRWDVGEKLVPHIDSPPEFEQYLGSGVEWPPSVVLYSSILYLNNNYSGGDIKFTRHGVSVSPKAGTLLLFPSTDMYLHEVTEITSGIRYTFTLFLSNKDMIKMFKRLYKIADTTYNKKGNDEI